MDAVALGSAGLMLVVGTYVGEALGAYKSTAAVFMVTDLTVCAGIINFPAFAGFEVTKMIAANIIGCLVGALFAYRVPDQNKEKFQLPEAIGTHILTIVGTCVCMHFFPALQPEDLSKGFET